MVKFVDIYPTLAALATLQAPVDLAGRSLGPLLAEPRHPWPHAAFTQILRPGDGRPVMGRTVRTERWRYTEWGGGAAGAELYDHASDLNEFTNLAKRPEHATTRTQLRALFAGRASADVPFAPFEAKRL